MLHEKLGGEVKGHAGQFFLLARKGTLQGNGAQISGGKESPGQGKVGLGGASISEVEEGGSISRLKVKTKGRNAVGEGKGGHLESRNLHGFSWLGEVELKLSSSLHIRPESPCHDVLSKGAEGGFSGMDLEGAISLKKSWALDHQPGNMI
jgi:hypothetical protein